MLKSSLLACHWLIGVRPKLNDWYLKKMIHKYTDRKFSCKDECRDWTNVYKSSKANQQTTRIQERASNDPLRAFW